MTSIPNTTGFRKMTPAMIVSQNLAINGITVLTTKSKVSSAVKRAAPALKLSTAQFWVMDILMRIPPADLFEVGLRPVFSISNESLAHQLGKSVRTVSRAIKGLCEKGLIAYRDSPSGKRFQHSRTKEAYGIDLTPLVNKIDELEELARIDKQMRDAKKAAQRAVSSLKRKIRELESAFSDDGTVYQSLNAQMSKVIGAVMSNQDKAESLKMIYDHGCNLILEETEKTNNNKAIMSCVGDTIGTHIQITNLEHIKDSNEGEQGLANANLFELQNLDKAEVKRAFEEVSAASAKANPPLLPQTDSPEPLKQANATLKASEITKAKARTSPQSRRTAAGSDLSDVSIGLIDSVTTQTRELLGDSFDCWADLVESSDPLRLSIGLSVDGWKQGVAALGAKMAAAILVVTVEKTLRDPLAISSPAGYFRACVERASEGKLMLAKSIYGLQQNP